MVGLADASRAHLGLLCCPRPPRCRCCVLTFVAAGWCGRQLCGGRSYSHLGVVPACASQGCRCFPVVGCPGNACVCVSHPLLSFLSGAPGHTCRTPCRPGPGVAQVGRFYGGICCPAQPAVQLSQPVAWALGVQPYRASCYGVRELSIAPHFHATYLTGAQLQAAARVVPTLRAVHTHRLVSAPGCLATVLQQ